MRITKKTHRHRSSSDRHRRRRMARGGGGDDDAGVPPPPRRRDSGTQDLTTSSPASLTVPPPSTVTPSKDCAAAATSSASSPRPRSSSPRNNSTSSDQDTPKCAICLGDLVNKSYSNTCIHEFCFGCLLEWSKVKPECPLCKSSFRSIYHNIRSNSDYDEYVVPAPVIPPPPTLPFSAFSNFTFRLGGGPPFVGGSGRSPDIMIGSSTGSSSAAAYHLYHHHMHHHTPALHPAPGPPFSREVYPHSNPQFLRFSSSGGNVIAGGGDSSRHRYNTRSSGTDGSGTNRFGIHFEVPSFSLPSVGGGGANDASSGQSSTVPQPFYSNPFQTDTPEFFGDLNELLSGRTFSSTTTTGLAIQSAQASSAADAANITGYQSRRRRYDRSQWVRPFESTLMPGTVFFPSVEYFQRHPTAIRRIVPWLYRELSVLMSLTNSRMQMAFAFDLITSLIQRYDIRSSDFRDLIRPYLGSRSRQFQHEFYYFVLSGMRMEEYDRIAEYPSAEAGMNMIRNTGRENPLYVEPDVVTILDHEEEGENGNISGVEVIDVDEPSTSSSRANANATATRSSGRSRLRRGTMIDDCGFDLLDDPEFIATIRPITPEVEVPATPTPTTPEPEVVAAIDEALAAEVSELEDAVLERDPEMPVLEPQVDWPELEPRRAATSDRVTEWLQGRDYTNTNNRPRTIAGDFLELLDTSRNQEEVWRTRVADNNFPILSLASSRREREKREGERNRRSDDNNDREWDRLTTTVSSAQAAATAVPAQPSTSNCVPSYSKFTGRLSAATFFGHVLDLTNKPSTSTSSRNHISNSRATSVIKSTADVEDDGECEFLGVHPVVKKPPLAVITLDDDEERNENKTDSDSSESDSLLSLTESDGHRNNNNCNHDDTTEDDEEFAASIATTIKKPYKKRKYDVDSD